MRGGVRDAIDITSEDGAVPNGDVCAQKNVTHHSGIGSHEYFSLIVDVQVIEIHDVAVSTHRFAVLAWGFDFLS